MMKSGRSWIILVIAILALDVAIAIFVLVVAYKNPVQPPLPNPGSQPRETSP